MKSLLIKLIRIYQNTPLISHNRCKYIPSCSEYMIMSLNKYGLIKGVYKGIKRILRCNPFTKGGIDLP